MDSLVLAERPLASPIPPTWRPVSSSKVLHLHSWAIHQTYGMFLSWGYRWFTVPYEVTVFLLFHSGLKENTTERRSTSLWIQADKQPTHQRVSNNPSQHRSTVNHQKTWFPLFPFDVTLSLSFISLLTQIFSKHEFVKTALYESKGKTLQLQNQVTIYTIVFRQVIPGT